MKERKTDISKLPYEWQQIVLKVLDMKRRIDFGISIPDPECPKEKLAIECCQNAIYEDKKK